MATIKNVVVLGASGDIGTIIAQALIEATFDVTIVQRPDSHKPPAVSSATYKVADYKSVQSLTAAFQGQDAIVEAFNPAAAAFQKNIISAAVAAGVKHVITPDFSSDTFNPHADELHIFEPKIKAQKELESMAAVNKITWTAIIPGAFFDWGINHNVFWINRNDHTVTIFGSGNQRISLSSISIVGRATVAVLRNVDRYKNRPAYFAEYTVNTNELKELVTEITNPTLWNSTNAPLEGFFEKAKDLWDQDTKEGVVDRLNTRAYPMLGTYALFHEDNRYNADFGQSVEPGWNKSMDELRTELKQLLSES